MQVRLVRTVLAVLGILSAALLLLGIRPASQPQADKQKGMSWVASPQPIGLDDLRPLALNHVNWIVQTPFGWQPSIDSPQIRLATGSRVHWGESDQGLRTTAQLARKLGIRTLLKPHIWLRRGADGKWRSDIAMSSPQDWDKWFENYRRFILHYARLAQQSGIEALCIGTELHQTAVLMPDRWRRIIWEIRQLYGGKLTYAANWYREFEEIDFWPELDYIGIQAYFPLSSKKRPSLDDLKMGWRPHLEAIQAVAQRYGKPILFTEIGYRSVPEAAIEPWKWPQHAPDSPVDHLAQANAYEAFFQTFWDRSWFAGAYFWKWYARTRRLNPATNSDFTPQQKPALQVLEKWYGR